jgi:hypothetical protein
MDEGGLFFVVVLFVGVDFDTVSSDAANKKGTAFTMLDHHIVEYSPDYSNV